MVRFAPQANAAEITAFLAANNAMIVGSTSDGTFRLLVPGKGNASEIVKKMSENKVVSSVLPVGK
jgi:hypothetical protein